MEPVPVLVGVEGVLAGRRFEVTTTGLRLGREAGNEVCIDDAGVSRQHARVILHNGAVWVQDAGSRNGVFVNAERVADHRVLKPGDRVSVGTHSFELQLAQPGQPQPPVRAAAPRIQPDARTVALEGGSPAPEAPRRFKAWPFLLAAFFTLGCIGCFGIYGWVRGEPVAEAPAAAPAYSLSTVLPVDGAPPPAAPPTVQEALAAAAGPASAATTGPTPPPGSSAAELVERAHALYETGRLTDALASYDMALQLDPACEICKVRIERLNAEIAEKAQAQLDAGLRYWDSMQVQQAVASWETVLLLVPDPANPTHQRAAEALARARPQ